MSPKILLPLFALAILLSACDSTEPVQEAPAIPEKASSSSSVGLASTGSFSSEIIIEPFEEVSY